MAQPDGVAAETLLRPTITHRRGADYRRPGGPWDGPTLDGLPWVADPTDDTPARVAALAGALRAEGVQRGDVVMWQFPNTEEVRLLYLACWRLGAVAAPVHPLAGQGDVERIRSMLDPRLALDDIADVRRMLTAGAQPALDSRARPADVAVVLLTSGSSGTPKAVLHTHRALAWKARLMTAVHGLHAGDAVLMPAPLAHISGLLNGCLLPRAAGLRVRFMDHWNPDHALDLIERERVTFMIGPPTFFIDLMGASGFSRQRVRSLRLISSGGAGVTPAFVDEATEAFACTVKRTYGSTEAPTVTTSHAGDPPERARNTDGRATGEVEMRLNPASGELLLRGPELFAGYLDAAQTAGAHTRGGWFRTGDVATIDDGWLTIVGRIKDVIIRGGENIASAEVESVLEAHPAVRQAVAVGRPDERLGERVVAFVVTGARFGLEDCRAWFAARGVAKFKWPEAVVTLDAMPTMAAGKPDRGALSELARTVGG
jgi:cyclohexanecarboxylate-CoA ligase